MIRLSETKRKTLIASAAFIHLALLATGMTHVWDLTKDPAVAYARHDYEVVTGATGGFGFFSPSVGQQLVLKLRLVDTSGIEKQVRLEELVSSEAAVRVGNMIRFLAYSYKDEKLRRSISASFAAFVFNRYPETAEVEIEGVAYRVPALVDYATGSRIEEESVYKIKFKKRANLKVTYDQQTNQQAQAN